MKLPDALEKKRLNYDSGAKPDDIRKAAEQFYAEERFAEAVTLYARLKDAAALDRLRNLAINAGDLFLFNACNSAQGQPADLSQLEHLSRAARSAGKTAYADAADAILHPPAPEGEAETSGDSNR